MNKQHHAHNIHKSVLIAFSFSNHSQSNYMLSFTCFAQVYTSIYIYNIIYIK